jgi:hypothetical protein
MDFETSPSVQASEPKKEQPVSEAAIPSGGRNYKTSAKKKDHMPVIVIGVLATALITIWIINGVTSGRPKSSSESSRTSSTSSSSTSYSGYSGSSSSQSSSSKYSSDEIMEGVYTLAEKCVKNHLKSPSSAKFCSMSDCEFQKGEDGVYMMEGTVESENSYGAMLKETWGIMAKVDGDKVSLVMVQIGDQVYFD